MAIDYWRELDEDEQEWADLQPFLQSRGYLLRRRYQPTWKPAKKENDTDETALAMLTSSVLDAIRISDRLPVVLKRIDSGRTELVAHLRIQSFPNSSKHVAPIYDTLLLPETDEYLLVVLPLLRPITLSGFTNLNEILDCTQQLMEGVSYLHENRCIHRDLSVENIHMQAPNMFPKGWHFRSPYHYHPGDPITSKASLKPAPTLPRSLAPPRYLLLDFGLSLALEPGEPHYRLGSMGTHLPPEMGPRSVIDAFAADIYALGVVLKQILQTSRPGSSYADANSILHALLDKLVEEDPKQRPTAAQALKELHSIIQALNDAQLRKTLEADLSWSFTEIKYGVAAILEGQGDEKVLFAKLRGRDPPKALSFAEGSLRERLELTRRVYKFLLYVGDKRNVLEWLAPKQSSK